MAELKITLRKYIGESTFNWDTFEFEEATSAEDVRMQVEYAQYLGTDVTSILLEIGTCFGGSTFEGKAIYHYLRGLNVPIKTRILAFAASMATILMLVGDECEIDAAAQLMVHGPSSDASGTVTDIRSGLQGLVNEHEALRDIYVVRTGQPVEVVEEWMSKDTFFSAQQALEAGLVTKVLPIAPRASKPVTEAQASARRAKYAGIVARAAQRPARRPFPQAKNAARAAAPSPCPMAQTTKKPAAAGSKPAGAKPAAPNKPAAAAPKPATLNANQLAVAAFAKQLGVKVTMDGANEPTAEVQTTELSNGALLYHDGPLAVDVAVYNDEALTEATGDGDYDAADGSVISVAGGVVTAIDTEAAGDDEETPDAETSTAAITAAVTAALKPLNERLDTMEAKFNKVVPPAPRPQARGGQAPDAKAPKPVAKPKASHHSTM